MRPALARTALALLSRLTASEHVPVPVQVRGTLVTVPVTVGEAGAAVIGGDDETAATAGSFSR